MTFCSNRRLLCQMTKKRNEFSLCFPSFLNSPTEDFLETKAFATSVILALSATALLRRQSDWL